MIAVTGANGLLGSFIVRKLLQEQKAFVALKRNDADTSLLFDVSDKIRWRNADIQDPIALAEAFTGCTSVIHTAAIVSFNPNRADEVMEINVEGTRNVVNVCLEKNIEYLVHVSSVAALGRQRGQTLIREENKWVENPMNSVYANSKYRAELEVFRGGEEGLKILIVNPSVILAPADWNRSSAKLFKYVWNQKPFYINAFLNYVDVRDVAACIFQLMERNYSGERIVLNAGNISFKTFFKKIADHFHVQPPSLKLSKNILNIVSMLEGWRTWLFGSEPLITRETAQLAETEFVYDNEKVKNILNFEFQTIDNTLEWCCTFYSKKFGPKK